MRLREAIQPKKEFYSGAQLKASQPISKIGSAKFNVDIFRERTLEPQEEMNYAIENYQNVPIITAGVDQYVRFILGDGVTLQAEFIEDKKKVEKWLQQRPHFHTNIRDLTTSALVAGNGYLQPVFVARNHKGKMSRDIDNFFAVPDPSRVFVNLFLDSDEYKGDESEAEYFIEVDYGTKSFMGRTPRYYRVAYELNRTYNFERKYAIALYPGELYQLKIGWNRNAYYGRSFLMSTLDVTEAMNEILKNIAIISKYRALNIKIVTPSQEGVEIIEDEVEHLKNELLFIEDGGMFVHNKKIDVMSLSNQGEYDSMIQELDFLRKEIQSGLTPNYLTPYASDVNRATAEQTKVPFGMMVESMQRDIELFLTDVVLEKHLRASLGLKGKIEFKLPNVNLDAQEEKINAALMKYNAGFITLNRALELLGEEKIKGGDRYIQEIQLEQQQKAQELMQPMQPQQPLPDNDDREFNVNNPPTTPEPEVNL